MAGIPRIAKEPGGDSGRESLESNKNNSSGVESRHADIVFAPVNVAR